MAQILDPLPNDDNKNILCCYVNATSKIQVARITNIEHWYFERVVFPGQRLVFEAVPQAMLEIHTGMMASAILSDTISCKRLAVDEGGQMDEECASEETVEESNAQKLETATKPMTISTPNNVLATAMSY